MRLRLPELLKERGMSRYAFAKAVEGRISESAAYRLAAGEWKCLPSATMDALCDVLRVGPGELFAFGDSPTKRTERKPAARKAAVKRGKRG